MKIRQQNTQIGLIPLTIRLRLGIETLVERFKIYFRWFLVRYNPILVDESVESTLNLQKLAWKYDLDTGLPWIGEMLSQQSPPKNVFCKVEQ